MNVRVITLSGSSFLLRDLSPDHLLRDLKQKLGEQSGCSLKRQRLVLNGIQLTDDDQSLRNCGISEDSRIHFIVRCIDQNDPVHEEILKYKFEIENLKEKLEAFTHETRSLQDTCLHETILEYTCTDCKLVLMNKNELDDFHEKKQLDASYKERLQKLEEDMKFNEEVFIESKQYYDYWVSQMQKKCSHPTISYHFGLVNAGKEVDVAFKNLEEAKSYLADTQNYILEQWRCKECYFIVGERKTTQKNKHEFCVDYHNRLRDSFPSS